MSYSSITGSAETAIHTTTEGLRHGVVDMPTFDGTIPAYFAAPADKARPALILVIQEIFGLHEHIRDVCRRFARQGYMAVAVDLYHRQGDAAQYSDMSMLINDIVSKVPDEQVLADLDASVKWAETQGADSARIGVTGFCWGGRLTWMYAAHNADCKAGVAWYGKLAVGHGPLQRRNPIDIANELKAPVLGLYGGQDASIPLTDVRRMQDALKTGSAAARASEVVVYPESGHAFYADYRPSYNAGDAQDAWLKALSWFKKYLV
ncbi:dienelactone hydrolase family protein [Candidimonas sp. SYP-B2681]|uniref:dienelactone hydrolase family protein n=1 Tax=Candidimonas sp. SYP-B2681 TaxID=2497686 RepID=UPI000F88A92B|nr:dienelactone hydrolase family protein [Candidimonas sp. SYP-B2681]RTZ44470.1 dienelactone hydrolase family protein [Candidimonas sp. SYP-B2681]